MAPYGSRRRDGCGNLPEVRFDEGALQTGLEVIANRFGKKLDADSPILNLRLPDGSRMAAMIPPVVNPRPLMTIRRFTSRDFTLADLVKVEMLTAQQAGNADAMQCAEDRTSSSPVLPAPAKSTLLDVLADAIPEHERILLIEDTAELHIRKPHVVSAESQTDTHRSQITFDDLLKAVLRHRPDRIIVGEVRGPEARTLLDAMNTGHRGTLATIHANSAIEALHRLATLALRGDTHADAHRITEEVERSLDMVVHIARMDGRRFVREIHEVARESSHVYTTG